MRYLWNGRSAPLLALILSVCKNRRFALACSFRGYLSGSLLIPGCKQKVLWVTFQLTPISDISVECVRRAQNKYPVIYVQFLIIILLLAAS